MSGQANIKAMMWAIPSSKVIVPLEKHIADAKGVFIKKFGENPTVLFIKAVEALDEVNRVTLEGMTVTAFTGMTPNHVVLALTAEDFLGKK